MAARADSCRDARSVAPDGTTSAPRGLDSEEWRPIPGWERWQVSSHGRVIGPRGWVLKTYLAGKYMAFRPGEREVNVYVHRAVALAFHGDAPEGCEVGHRDGNRLNNRADNLGWVTPLENGADRVRHGTTHRGRRFIPREVEEYILLLLEYQPHLGLSINAIARMADVSADSVRRVREHGARQPIA